MTIILLCGGYATRLYPFTKGKPKALLKVGGVTLLDRIIETLPRVDQVIIVTSRRSLSRFHGWMNTCETRQNVTVVCDNTDSDADKIGAAGDLSLALQACCVTDDIIVIAPDNVFTHPLSSFVEFCHGRTQPVIGVYDVKSLDRARQYGVVFNMDGHVCIEEKPDNPRSTLVGVGLYYYPRALLTKIHAYLESGGEADAPGYLMAHFAAQTMVRTWPVPGLWFDIGSKEALDEAERKLLQ